MEKVIVKLIESENNYCSLRLWPTFHYVFEFIKNEM